MRAEILQGDAVTMLRTLPNGYAHTCVTSPPYYALRDYGTASWEGGNPACDHLRGNDSWVNGRNRAAGPKQIQKSSCGKCGAVRVDNQLGLEDTLDCLGWATGDRCGACYICRIVDVFREVRRVLRDDGTAWVNMGDSYCCAANGRSAKDTKATGKDDRTFRDKPQVGYGRGLKPKDLCMQPARVALALQYDGWYLRSDIIWAKSNAMPESVTDRPAKSHEYIFLLAKSSRYAYDAEAIKEEINPSQVGRVRSDVIGGASWQERGQHSKGGTYSTPTGRDTELGSHGTIHKDGRRHGSTLSGGDYGRHFLGDAIPEKERCERDYETAAENYGEGTSASRRMAGGGEAAPCGMKNKRTVWQVPARGYADAHFATFPPDLIKPCILAGCPEGGTVLDPFAGSGTTLYVANSLCRHAVGIELNPEYVRLIEKRLAQGFMDWTEEPEPPSAPPPPPPPQARGLFDGDGEGDNDQ